MSNFYLGIRTAPLVSTIPGCMGVRIVSRAEGTSLVFSVDFLSGCGLQETVRMVASIIKIEVALNLLYIDLSFISFNDA